MNERRLTGLFGGVLLAATLVVASVTGCSAGDEGPPPERINTAQQPLTCTCASTTETCQPDTQCMFFQCDPCCGPNCYECNPHYQGFGTNCNDGNVCTLNDYCDGNGNCKPGTGVPNCNDNNPCTQDSCDPTVGGCKNTPTPGIACDDFNACTTNDKCIATGACQGGATLNCDDNNACTVDACDPQGGTNPCKHTSSVGAACNDSNQCTSGEKCDVNGACNGGTTLDCNDNNPCTIETCQPASGCTYTNNNGATCSDNNLCTTGDTCSGGTCAGGAAVNCNDNNPCTTDSCNATSGCVHVSLANTTPCDDGNGCTTGDQCTNGVCAGTGGPSCNDNNPCTKNTCAAGVCSNPAEPDNTPCDDSDACTVNDHCAAAKCTGTPIGSCDDNNPCTTDSCDPKQGCVHLNADGIKCEDGNACTVSDSCAQGKCSGKPLDCAPIDDCHEQGTCTNGTCDNPEKKDGSPCPGGTCSSGTCILTSDGGLGGTGGTDGGVGGAKDGGGTGGSEGGPGGTSGTGASSGAGGSGNAGATGKDGGEGETYTADPAGCKCRAVGEPGANSSGFSGWIAMVGVSLAALGARSRRRNRVVKARRVG